MKKLILCLTVALTFVFFGLAFSGCDGCGGKTDNAEDCKHVHVSENIIEATCSLDGQKTVACTDCGYVFPVEKLPALGHDLGEAKVTPADCLLSERRVRQCGRCGEYVEEIVGEPLGHDYEEISTIPATCTEPETVNKECSRCGIGKTEPKENGQAALGHNYERVTSRDIAATCTTAGEEYYECTRCKDGYSDVIAPKGHTPDGDGEVFEPTCVLKGYILKHCTVCNENYKENFVEALGHDLEDGYTVAATCDRMGYDTKVCSRCDYEEKCNVTQNAPHTFDASGVCTSCRKKATDSFALTCEGSELFAITQDGNIYTVYAPSYKWWNKLVMPAEVVQALYEQGVYSFNIKLGSNADPEIKAMSIQVQGGTAVNLNVSLNEMKEIETYVFADEDGVFASAEDGIMFEVYYRVMAELDELVGKPRATCFAICFEYEIPFKAGDESTYFKTTLPYSYDGASGIYTFTDVKNNEFNMISLRGELLEYYSDLGYKALDITVGTAAGQHYGKNIVASSNGEVIVASGNINDMAVTLKGIELQSLLGYDLDLACYCTDHYGTGWDPEDPFDRILVTLTFVNDVYAYEETSGTPIRYTSVAEGNTVTYTFESVPNATFNRFYFNESFIAEKIAAGYTGVSFVIDTWGSKAATLYENDTVKGSVTTNGSDPFDCGVIPLTEDASYYIRLYHNLPTGNAKPSDITVVVQFVKDVYAYRESGSVEIGYTAVTGTTATENDTVTYTFEAVENGTFNRFCFNESFFAEKIAAGYTDVRFVIDTWGNKEADLYENENLIGHVLTNGSDAFDCGVVPLTENAYYYIRLYHNLPTGDAKPSDITVIVQFLKPVYAYKESDNSAIGYTAVTGTTLSENDTVTYTFESVENGTFNRFCFNESFFAEKIAEGYTQVSFVIDTWGNKEADLYENENLIGHVLTNGSDAFDCGVIPLTANADYNIRLYHNLPTGDAKPSDITVIVQFIKPESAVLSKADSWGYHYHGIATGVSANNGEVSVSAAKYASQFRGFTLKPSAIRALYDLGYGAVSFTITVPDGCYIDIYNMVDPASCIAETPIYIDGTEYYYASGTTVTLNLSNLVSDTALMNGEGIKFVVTSTAGWTAYDQDCTVTFSDIEFKKPEIPWNDSIKLKIATTTGDFGGSSGNLADDKAKLDKLHAAGFKYVDLSMYSFTAGCDYMQADWSDKIAELKDYADSLGMTFVQAHSQGGNALDEGQYDTLVAYTLRQIEICGQLGIENIVVHPGFKSGYTKQQWFDGNKVFFDALLVKAAECGVNVLCENSTSKNLGSIYWANSGSDMREFIEYVNNPYFHACWDTGHGNCEGPQYDDILALGDELYAIHFNDNMGNGDFHLIPYYGTLDCDIVIRALNNIGYTGYFTFECDGGNRTNGSWYGPNDLSALSGNDPSDLTREQQERLLYEIGEYLLISYDMFAE